MRAVAATGPVVYFVAVQISHERRSWQTGRMMINTEYLVLLAVEGHDASSLAHAKGGKVKCNSGN